MKARCMLSEQSERIYIYLLRKRKSDIMDLLVQQLKELLDEQKEFLNSDEVKSILNTKKSLSDKIKNTKEEIFAEMQEQGLRTFEKEQFKFSIKETNKKKHDLALLKETVKENVFNEYVEKIQTNEPKLITKRQKRS